MDWRPHPKQEEALKRIEFEVLYGGARGGGKTDAGLVWLTDHIDKPQYRALVIRKNADDLSDWIDRAVKFYSGLGAQIAYRPAVIRFPSGAIIRTGHLKDDQAYTKYQGHEYQRMLIEELTQIPEEKRYLQLLSSCRSTVPEIKPQVFATTNPGGVGHLWVKERFVDPAPPNIPFQDKVTGRTRIYVPATVDDNPTLSENDPGYIQFLEGLKETDVDLWKAWRLGDWTTFAGQFFKEFRMDHHVIKGYSPDKRNVIVGGLDWGRTDPFAWVGVEVKKVDFEGLSFYRATMFTEAYGVDKLPREWGEIIKRRLQGCDLSLKDISWIQADTQIFVKQSDGSKSIRDQFVDEDRDFVMIHPASKDRVGGWEYLHNWFSLAPDGLPYFQIAENCINTIRTLPSLVHDENKVEDIDTTGEDHAADAIRYCLKRLKWIDAVVGGIGKSPKPGKQIYTAVTKEGRQVSIDPGKFATAWSKRFGRMR
jgi:hypothetical protein